MISGCLKLECWLLIGQTEISREEMNMEPKKSYNDSRRQ